MPLNFILKFEMHCHGKFLLNFYSLWKCGYKTAETVNLKKKAIMNSASCDKAVTSRHSPAPELWGSLTHFTVSWGLMLHGMKQSIWLRCEMCHLALVVEIETSVCLPTILRCAVFCSKVTLFSHLKCSFLLQWLHCLVAQVCQGRIRLAQIMKIRRPSTYPEPWQDHYLRITVPI